MIDFWKVKHEIDHEVRRLGWDTSKCRQYIQDRYNKRSRLVMSDEQLLELLATLRNLSSSEIIQPLSSRKGRKRKRR